MSEYEDAEYRIRWSRQDLAWEATYTNQPRLAHLRGLFPGPNDLGCIEALKALLEETKRYLDVIIQPPPEPPLGTPEQELQAVVNILLKHAWDVYQNDHVSYIVADVLDRLDDSVDTIKQLEAQIKVLESRATQCPHTFINDVATGLDICVQTD